MSTRSFIAYYNEDTNQIHGTYCHFDGYPEWMIEALFDAIVSHGFDAISGMIESAAKTGGIRQIPKGGAEWDVYTNAKESWLRTFPGNTSDAKWRELLSESHYEHVYVLSRITHKFNSVQSASIFHVKMDESASPNRNMIGVPHVEKHNPAQMVLSFA